MEKTDRDIKSLLKEAEIYHQQGLFEQSIEIYMWVLKFIESDERLSKNTKQREGVKNKIKTVKKVLAEVDETSDTPELSEGVQNLISKLFSSSRNKEMAAIEGAVALARFGQYEKAFSEFDTLIEKGNLPIVAAKNLLRCLITDLSPDAAIGQTRSWEARHIFSGGDLEHLKNFLKKELNKRGITADLSEDDALIPETAEAQEQEEDFHEINLVHIKLVHIKFHQGPRVGESAEFNVTFQRGNLISFIIPQSEKAVLAAFQPGSRLTEIQCFSDMGLFQGSGVVSRKRVITSGPKRGDYSLDITLDVALLL